MSSEKRSRPVSGHKHFTHQGLLALHDSPSSELRTGGSHSRERSRSVSRPPTGRVPLDRDTNDKTHPGEPKGRFPASFEFQSPPRVHTPLSKPVKGILKNSISPIRPCSASPLLAKLPTSAASKDTRTRGSFHLRTFSSLPFSPLHKAATPAENSPTKPSPITASRATAMSGKASGGTKPRDATALYDMGPNGSTDKRKKAVPVNGSKSKRASESSDEGSSSSDEESSESSSDSSDDESTASEKESKAPGSTAKPAMGAKKAASASESESSDSESESSDESDDDTSGEKMKSPLAVTQAVTNGAMTSSSEEESDSETESGGAKVAGTKEIPNSSTESSDEEEDSDEEMDDTPPSGQGSGSAPKPAEAGSLRAAQRTAPEPAPSVMDGGFKLQKAQNLGQMASLLSEANAKGDRVWLLTHPSTTPLNLEVQKVFTSSENHMNSIMPNGAKLTYPVASEGSNIHTISGCAGITVTQTMRHEADISSLAQVMSELRHAKEAPTQPAGLRTRYLPIGVSRASPTLEDSPASAHPRSSEKPKKDKKRDKKEVVPSSQPEQSSERPSKKRKVSPADETGSSEAAVKTTSKTQGSSQHEASSQAEPGTEKRKKKSKKSKAEEAPEEAQEDTPAKASKKQKVKFAADETPLTSTPIPPPSIPSSQPQETPSKNSKKKRRLANEADPASEKPEKKGQRESAQKGSTWSRPEEVKVTPVAPPSVPGMR